jgi:ubiquitin C-terminal hydrolase
VSRVLVGIAVHSGVYGSGHYVAYIRSLPYALGNAGRWYKFDDDKCTEVLLETVLLQCAYVLVYRRPWE